MSRARISPRSQCLSKTSTYDSDEIEREREGEREERQRDKNSSIRKRMGKDYIIFRYRLIFNQRVYHRCGIRTDVNFLTLLGATKTYITGELIRRFV